MKILFRNMILIAVIISHFSCLSNSRTGDKENGDTAVKENVFRMIYTGSSQNYTIYFNEKTGEYILQLVRDFKKVRYLLGSELSAGASRGDSLIDEVNELINDDSELISAGMLKIIQLPDELFKDF